MRGHRPPRSTIKVPTRRALGPRTLARLDAQSRRRTRRDGRLGRPRARPPHMITRPRHLHQLRLRNATIHSSLRRRGHHPATSYRGQYASLYRWLARAETIAARSLQPYFAAIDISFATTSRSRWRWDHSSRMHAEDSPCSTNPSPTPTFASQSQHPW
jgi:hypothetical protein